VIHDWGKVVTR